MNRVLSWALLAALASLAWLSAHLAATRFYQAEECQNIYMASILAAGQEKAFFTDASGFTIPLACLVNGAARSADRFASARLVMLGIFWLNLALIALCMGEKLVSRRGLIALFAAATLAPLWDFGFEIRHDNVLLTGLLLMWCVLRVRPNGPQSYFIAGAVALGLQFLASKAFAYTAPLSLAFLVFPPAAHTAPRWKLTLAWFGGAISTLLLVRLAYGALGLWNVYFTDIRGFSDVSAHAARFTPWATLGRLPSQTPFLLALIAGGLVALIAESATTGKGGSELGWKSARSLALSGRHRRVVRQSNTLSVQSFAAGSFWLPLRFPIRGRTGENPARSPCRFSCGWSHSDFCAFGSFLDRRPDAVVLHQRAAGVPDVCRGKPDRSPKG